MIQLYKENKFKNAFRSIGGKIANGTQAFSKKANVAIEQHVKLGHVKIESPSLTIGAHTYIRSDAVLSVVSQIGRFCSVGSGCTIGQEKQTHPLDWVSTHPFAYESGDLVYEPKHSFTIVGHDVWIGHNATILEGVTIGTGAIVATRAVVTKDVPPYAIVGGNPAKVIRYRHDESTIQRLLDSKWWNFDYEFLLKLPMNAPLEFLNAIEQNATIPIAEYKSIRISKKKISLTE